MYIIRDGNECGVGDTLQEAILDFQSITSIDFDPRKHFVYYAEKVEVQMTLKYSVVE